MAAIPDDQQIAMLKVGLKFIDRADDMTETLVQMYIKRQMGAAMPFQLALAAQSGISPTVFDGFKKSLLVDRNARMRDAALPMLEKGKRLRSRRGAASFGADGSRRAAARVWLHGHGRWNS